MTNVVEQHKTRIVEPGKVRSTDVADVSLQNIAMGKDVGPWNPAQENAKIFRTYPFNLAPGVSVTFFSESKPEFWTVAVFVQAGADIWVYLSNGPFGDQIPLGSGGNCKLPAVGPMDAVTILNHSGSLTTRGIVFATRGVEASIYPGGA